MDDHLITIYCMFKVLVEMNLLIRMEVSLGLRPATMPASVDLLFHSGSQPTGGPTRPPQPWETGYKDTVLAHPGEITRIKALFDRAGLFVWHCHIVEHEDNEMMRPYFIGRNPPTH